MSTDRLTMFEVFYFLSTKAQQHHKTHSNYSLSHSIFLFVADWLAGSSLLPSTEWVVKIITLQDYQAS